MEDSLMLKKREKFLKHIEKILGWAMFDIYEKEIALM